MLSVKFYRDNKKQAEGRLIIEGGEVCLLPYIVDLVMYMLTEP